MEDKSVRNILISACILLFLIVIMLISKLSVPFYEFSRGFESRDTAAFVYGFLVFATIFCAIAIILCAATAIWINKQINLPIEKKSGKVLDKQKSNSFDVLTIEFDDGTRKTLTANRDVILTVGDTGVMEYRGHVLIGFHK